MNWLKYGLLISLGMCSAAPTAVLSERAALVASQPAHPQFYTTDTDYRYTGDFHVFIPNAQPNTTLYVLGSDSIALCTVDYVSTCNFHFDIKYQPNGVYQFTFMKQDTKEVIGRLEWAVPTIE